MYFFQVNVVKTYLLGLKIQVSCKFCNNQFGQRRALQNTEQIHINFTKNSFHKRVNKKSIFMSILQESI